MLQFAVSGSYVLARSLRRDFVTPLWTESGHGYVAETDSELGRLAHIAHVQAVDGRRTQMITHRADGKFALAHINRF